MCCALSTNLRVVSGGFYLCRLVEDINVISLYVKPVCDGE